MGFPEEDALTTDEDYGLLGLRPEAISNVPVATRDAKRHAATGRVLSYLGKRAKRPVTAIGDELKESIMVLAMQACIGHRGARPSGQDADMIAGLIKFQTEWLDKVRLGLVEPYFVDSTTAVHEFGPLGGSSPKADDWVDP